jgi:putative heme-binding domain-containing protein
MYGAFYVVADLDSYLADPSGYLARNPLPISDELLKNNRPRKEWTVDDLASTVEALDRGRSFGNGKQMFQVGSCVSCHRLNGVGEQVGPDLAKLDPKTSKLDILRNLIEPSAKVEDKYRTNVFQTKGGRIVTGLVLEETPQHVKVIENPLAKSAPLLIEKTDIEERTVSPSSIMPKGLLDKLTREEILDLVAYISARGDANSPIFQAQPGHAHGH